MDWRCGSSPEFKLQTTKKKKEKMGTSHLGITNLQLNAVGFHLGEAKPEQTQSRNQSREKFITCSR
jgi:hypothetical protein